MAKHFLRGESAPVILPDNFSEAAAVLAQHLLDRFNRDDLGAAIEVLVELLDVWDGDPDVEPNGDETDHDRAEDCFSIGPKDHANGPGCNIGDPDCAVDDTGCDDDDMDRDEGWYDFPGHIGGGTGEG